MNLDERITEALARIDQEPVPGGPLDPDALAARASTGATDGGRANPGATTRPTRWLALAAAIVLVAGVAGLWLVRPDLRGVPAGTPTGTPAAPAASGWDAVAAHQWRLVAIHAGGAAQPPLPSRTPLTFTMNPGAHSDAGEPAALTYDGLNWVTYYIALGEGSAVILKPGPTTAIGTSDDPLTARTQLMARQFAAVRTYEVTGDSLVFGDESGPLLVYASMGPAPSDPYEAHNTPPPGTPAAPTVEVDIFSGRPNPVVTLDRAVAEQVFMMVADQRAAQESEPGEPELGTGFRGFLVTQADAFVPRMRILPHTIHVEDPAGPYTIRNSQYYQMVYDAVRPLLDADVVAALPPTDPPVVVPKASMPPLTGAPALWALAEPDAVGPTTTVLTLEVMRAECSGGVTGTVLEPTITFSDSEVLIRAAVEPLAGTAFDCRGNPVVRHTVTLPEPLGERTLMDAACLVAPHLRTSTCAQGATRWSPATGPVAPQDWPR